MNLNDLFENLRKFKKYKLINYKCLVLSILLTTNLSVSTAYAPSDDNNNYYKSLLYFKDSIESSVDVYSKYVFDYIQDIKDPLNLDFSDFPYSDGSVESQLNIARYIREKVKHIPNTYKYNYILVHWLFTEEEFNDFYAVIYREGKLNDGTYELTFANVTNVFNRVISRYKSAIARNKLHIDGPVSLYQHIIAPGQYSPYGSGDYLDYIGFREEESYQAVLDSLFVMDVMPERMHNYLDFVANGLQDRRPGSVQLVKGGNWFSYPQPEDDILPLEERYYYTEEINLKNKTEENILSKKIG